MDDLRNSVGSKVDGQVRIGRLLVDIVNTGETLDLSVSRSLVKSSSVDLLAPLERGSNVDEEVVTALAGDLLLDGLSGSLVRSGGGSDDGGTGLGELGSNETNSKEVLVLVLLRGAEIGRELVPDVLAKEQGDRSSAVLLKGDLEGTGNGVLARVVETGKEDSESLLRSGRVGLSQNLDDAGVREPVGDRGTSPQSLPELSTGDVGGRGPLGNLVDRLVLVAAGKVGHGLEGNHLDLEFVLELSDELLSIVRAVEVLSLRVLSGSGVVSTDDLT